jgi:IclR family transcriptional regulator, KDG regulon repressor
MVSKPQKSTASRPILNALHVLETMANASTPLALADVSRLCRLPKATAMRYLAAFEQCGYVVRSTEHGKYSLGAKVVGLARRFYGTEGLLSVARGRLLELAQATQETAHLGVLRLPDIIYVDIAESPQSVRAIIPRGEHLPAYCVASGRAILAHSDKELVERVIAGGLKRRTKFTITKRGPFLEELKRINERGYAANVGEWIEDVVGISSPVFSPDGNVFAAVGVSLPTSRIRPKRIESLGEIVSTFARELSAGFGSSPDRRSEAESKL